MHFFQISLLALVGTGSLAAAGSNVENLEKLRNRQTSTQSLVDALGSYADLSSFQQILKTLPGLVNANVNRGATVLVPTNTALSNFVKLNNATDVSQLPVSKLQSIFQYHTLDASLSTTNFSSPRGLTVPTKLTDSVYNLRSPGLALLNQFGADANGQVLYISKDTANPSKFRVRQSAGEKSSLRAGLGQSAELTGIDGKWDGGYFQAIDTVLEVPEVCSTTIKKLSDSLSSLDDALRKVSLWQELDKKPNITCLGPNTDAFKTAGNPEQNLNNSALTDALLFHTLPEVAYSNFLTDGQELKTLSNQTIKVTIRDSNIWFNDAKVVNANVLTNNGLIHVLDRVMSADGTPDDAGSPSPTSSGTANPSSTGNPPNAGNAISRNLPAAGVIAFAAVMLLT
ncbi:beta-ig-h3 fasciclin [Colletotrichum sojae]|uniref:Beta-ig-h3 fasciclin n=1 Tax=Colletotrichum sojae TaxID=2175907 RepID=A0A8H6JN24_9PEZI|nr:beta-ig-h3 fasciclin [Colletotrichum sojae]